MKAKTAKTGFDRYFSERMKDRKFTAAYKQARAGIDSVDAFMRSLEEARTLSGVSKAKLAQLTGTQPAAMRRLLTTDAPNPTLSTVMSILKSLGYGLALVPNRLNSRQKHAKPVHTPRSPLPRLDTSRAPLLVLGPQKPDFGVVLLGQQRPKRLVLARNQHDAGTTKPKRRAIPLQHAE